MMFVRIASIIRPPDSDSVQRETTTLTTSALYSNGILYRASTRNLIRFNCNTTILTSISSDKVGTVGLGLPFHTLRGSPTLPRADRILD